MLPEARARLSERRRRQIVTEIESDANATTPYRSGAAFVERFAAAVETYPDELKRRRKGKTVFSIMLNVRLPKNIEHLLHGPRGLAAASPGAGTLNGTVTAEGTAQRLKAAFSSVTQILLRTALSRIRVFAFKHTLLTYIKATVPVAASRKPQK